MKKKIDKRTTKKTTKVKVSVTIDKKLHKQACKFHSNFSEFTNEAVKQYLAYYKDLMEIRNYRVVTNL